MAQLQNALMIHTQQSDTELHIAGIVVHSRPQNMDASVNWLATLPGVEICARSEQGKLAVVMESRRARDILDLIDRARERPGVVSAALIYHEIIPPHGEGEP